MKIKTWIKYEESYIPPRCRKPRYNECEDYVDINLSEATMNDLRLAFEDSSYYGAGKIFFYNGKLWAQAKLRNSSYAEEHGFQTALDELVWCHEHCSTYFRFDFDREHYGKDTSRQGVIEVCSLRKAPSRGTASTLSALGTITAARRCPWTTGTTVTFPRTAISLLYRGMMLWPRQRGLP